MPTLEDDEKGLKKRKLTFQEWHLSLIVFAAVQGFFFGTFKFEFRLLKNIRILLTKRDKIMKWHFNLNVWTLVI
jgi:hypothetical protein